MLGRPVWSLWGRPLPPPPPKPHAVTQRPGQWRGRWVAGPEVSPRTGLAWVAAACGVSVACQCLLDPVKHPGSDCGAEIRVRLTDALCTETDEDSRGGWAYPGPSQIVHLGEEPRVPGRRERSVCLSVFAANSVERRTRRASWRLLAGGSGMRSAGSRTEAGGGVEGCCGGRKRGGRVAGRTCLRYPLA